MAAGAAQGLVGQDDAVGVVGDLLVPEGEEPVCLEGLRGMKKEGPHLGEGRMIGEEENGVLEGGNSDGSDGMGVDRVGSVLL